MLDAVPVDARLTQGSPEIGMHCQMDVAACKGSSSHRRKCRVSSFETFSHVFSTSASFHFAERSERVPSDPPSALIPVPVLPSTAEVSRDADRQDV